MHHTLKTTLALAGVGALFAAGGVGTAVAAAKISGDDIVANSITKREIGSNAVGRSELRGSVLQQLDKQGEQGPAGEQGPEGPAGPAGPSGLADAFYSVAFYDVGDTNAGAVATVACDPESTDFTAIAGGVQTLGLDGTPLDNNTPVASSFPGRMDFSTNTPKPDRLDGWIIQFGGTDNPPLRAKVWALCVPTTDIPVVQTYTQSEG